MPLESRRLRAIGREAFGLEGVHRVMNTTLLMKVVATPWATKGVGKQPTPDWVLRGVPGKEKAK